MRLDRLITIYLFRHLARQRKPRGLRIPILMYHSISDERESGHPYFWINTSPRRFSEHMKFLHDNDYKVIPLSEAVGMIKGEGYEYQSWLHDRQALSSPGASIRHSPIPSQSSSKKFVVLTFDDGYRDFYTHAFPVLRKFGFTATVFLPTEFIGNDHPGLCSKQHLAWDEIRELAGRGITFGSHTCTHPQLHEVNPEALQEELVRSRFIINKEVGTCTEFCYPYKFPEQDANFVSTLSKTLKSEGYGCCLSTRIGIDHEVADLFAMKRIPVNSGDDLSLFDAKLNGAYDWIYGFQSIIKEIRGQSKPQTAAVKRPISTNQTIGQL
jgi:peptidoglycan/xylan/chitin deacetylase (PgdA/CDA1 family)